MNLDPPSALPCVCHHSKLREVLEVNVIGTTHLTQLFIPALRQSHGRIVMISSILGAMTFPTRAAYCASKHAMEVSPPASTTRHTPMR